MQKITRRAAMLGAIALVSACAGPKSNGLDPYRNQKFDPPLYVNETPKLRFLINKYADHYEVPRSLVHRIILRESHHRPEARNGPYFGLMQLLPATAKGMGYRGSPSGLLDAETNLNFGVKYLRGAWLVSNGSQDAAESWYSKGYYYEAKRRGMLVETGLRR